MASITGRHEVRTSNVYDAKASRTRKVFRLLGRTGIAFVVLLGMLAMSGAIFQEVASRSAARDFPPPGEMVDVGDHDIHLYQTGTEHDGPTVVLLAGAGSMSTQWAWIQREASAFAHVVSYDRAGLGWSEPSDAPRDAHTAAAELRRALETADIPGPYIIVGHSLGGAHAQVFADLYREDVAGVVLLDPVSPEFWNRVDLDALDAPRQAASQAKLFPYLARLGVLRIYNPLGAAANGLPEDQRASLQALFASTEHAKATSAEYQETLESSATMQQLRQLAPTSDLPLTVLSRTEPNDAYTGPQQEIGAEIASTSINGSHRLVEGADHLTMVTDEDYARYTTNAIEEIVERIASSGD